jgi:hypothetical protein
MFGFVESDLCRSIKDIFVLAGNVSYGDVGLTKKQYIACENIDFFHQWDSFDVNVVRKYGFVDIEAYRVANVRSHVYNLIKACRQDTLLTVLSAYGCTCVDDANESNHNAMTLEDVLKNVTVETLFRVGWTFWSIPLGSFTDAGRQVTVASSVEVECTESLEINA